MNIVQDYSATYSTKRIDILKVNYIGNFVLNIFFEDGKETIVDFRDFIFSSQHPDIKKYSNEEEFKKFKIIDGNLNWNDYDMIFPLIDLYNGKIS